MMLSLPKAALIAILLVGIAAGIFFRFDRPLGEQLTHDEITNFIAATKLHIPHPEYDPRLFNFEHPFLGKWIMGIQTEQNEQYPSTRAQLSNVFAYNYISATELRQQEEKMRFITALFGALALIPLFCIGKWIYGTEAGLIAAFLGALSIGWINQSRVAYQDAFLPFFALCAIYFALRCIESRPTEKILHLPAAWGWGGIFLLTLTASLLVRVGQPILVAIACIVVATAKRKEWKIILLASVGAGAIAIAGYGIDAIRLMLEVRGNTPIPFAWNMGFLQGMVAQNSWAFLVLGGITLCLATRDRFFPQLKFPFSNIEKNTQETRAHTEWKILRWGIGIILIGCIFTAAGAQPRFYALFFAIAFIAIGGFIATRIRMEWKIPLLAIIMLLDVTALAGTGGNYYNYTPAGLLPAYGNERLGDAQQAMKYLREKKITAYYTNDARLILRDSAAIPIPPKSVRYPISSQCNYDFFAEKKEYVLVYAGESVERDKYICPYVISQKKTIIAQFPDSAHANVNIYRMQSN